MRPAEAGPPQDRAEDYHGQEEKDAGDLQPQDAANPAKRLQETPDSLGHSARGVARNLARNLARGAAHDLILAGSGCGSLGWLAGCDLGAGGYALAGDACGDAQSDAESAADGLRLHFDMMVTARLAAPLFDRLRPVDGCSQAALELR
jgi:hypothetical protein